MHEIKFGMIDIMLPVKSSLPKIIFKVNLKWVENWKDNSSLKVNGNVAVVFHTCIESKMWFFATASQL